MHVSAKQNNLLAEALMKRIQKACNLVRKCTDVRCAF